MKRAILDFRMALFLCNYKTICPIVKRYIALNFAKIGSIKPVYLKISF